MTNRKSIAKAPAKGGTGDQKPLVVQAEVGDTEGQTMARMMLSPYLRHGVVAAGLADKMVGKLPGEPGFDDYSKSIKQMADRAAKGDMSAASEMLMAQALSLDAMFTELARRAAINFGDYPLAAERYARIAYKAQSNSRATLEALAKLHQPRVQTVRHVHVNEGGQAVIADQFHHHTGGEKNAEAAEQPHATGTGAAGAGPALPSPDPIRQTLPVASGEGKAAMPDARGQRQRST